MGGHDDLDARLEALAALVRPGEPMIDVGTDHARLPTALVARGTVPRAIASDIVPGPLEGAAARIDAAGLRGRVATRLAPGLEGLQPDEATTAVIAGMGGRRIAAILDDGPLEPLTRLVLSPHTETPLVRQALARTGFAAHRDHVLDIDGRFYWFIAAERADPTALNEREPRAEKPVASRHVDFHHGLLVGTVAADRTGADYERWVAAELQRVEGALSQIENRPQDEERRRRLSAQRNALVWARASR